MPYNALYYPWIEPQSRATLATAMLYWDRMSTIVPAHMGAMYDSPEANAAHKLGFLQPREVHYDCSEVITASKEFLDDINRPAIHAEICRLRARDARHASGRVRLHVDKISMPLRDAVAGRGLPDREGFLRVDPAIGWTYMTRLAAVVARADKASPFTDRTASHNLVVDRYVTPTAEAAEAVLATLSFSQIRISNQVPLRTIWQFRESHFGELQRYRRALRRLTRTIPRGLDEQELHRECTAILRDDVRPSTEEIAAKLGESAIDFSLAACESASLSAVAAGVAIGLATGSKTAGITVAAGQFGVRISFAYCKRRIARYRAWSSPFAYLVHANARFSGGDSK